jgi:hypothetical protein
MEPIKSPPKSFHFKPVDDNTPPRRSSGDSITQHRDNTHGESTPSPWKKRRESITQHEDTPIPPQRKSK